MTVEKTHNGSSVFLLKMAKCELFDKNEQKILT